MGQCIKAGIGKEAHPPRLRLPQKRHKDPQLPFPVGFTVAAADLAIELGRAATGDDLVGGGAAGFIEPALFVLLPGVFNLAISLLGAPGKIGPGIGADVGGVHLVPQHAADGAQGGRQAGGLGNEAVVAHQGEGRHKPAHAGAADARALPEGNGGEGAVDIGLELVDQPLHGGFAQGFVTPQPAVIALIGQVFAEPLVPHMAALHAHDDHGLVPVRHVFLQPPAFAVGGVSIPKQIVPVEEVHDGIGRLSPVRHADVQRAVGGDGMKIKVLFVTTGLMVQNSGSIIKSFLVFCSFFLKIGLQFV